MDNELQEQMTKIALPEDHEAFQALGANGPHDSFRVRVAVRAFEPEWARTQRRRYRVDTGTPSMVLAVADVKARPMPP